MFTASARYLSRRVCCPPPRETEMSQSNANAPAGCSGRSTPAPSCAPCHAAATALCIMTMIFSACVVASELTPEQGRSIYMLAHSQAGLPLPDRAPTIHVTTQENIRALLGCGRCRPSGAQIKEDVYVDDELDFSKAYDASILLHEFVHYLQWSAAGPAKSCEEWQEREQRAIAVQTRVLAASGADTMRVRLSGQLLQRACRGTQ